jgi:hypothetical protein
VIWHSGIFDVQSFWAVDCDSDHYLVTAKVTARLTVKKQRSLTFNVERFNLKKLNKVEGKEQYPVEATNRFAASEDFDAEVDINIALESIRQTKKSYPHYRPWMPIGL